MCPTESVACLLYQTRHGTNPAFAARALAYEPFVVVHVAGLSLSGIRWPPARASGARHHKLHSSSARVHIVRWDRRGLVARARCEESTVCKWATRLARRVKRIPWPSSAPSSSLGVTHIARSSANRRPVAAASDADSDNIARSSAKLAEPRGAEVVEGAGIREGRIEDEIVAQIYFLVARRRRAPRRGP